MRCYLDYNASAPMKEEVKEYVKQLVEVIGNPSSIHTNGRKSKNIIEISRKNIASILNCKANNIIFTSGATEANNLALSGYKNKIISSIEHESIKNQENTIRVNVDSDGYIDLNMLENVLKSLKNEDKNIISVMHANNETGIIQPIEKIKIISDLYNTPFHSDAVQVLGRLDIDFLKLGIDMITVSSHKIGGPSGAGALIVSSKKNILKPLLLGGQQEDSLRSGTEPLLSIAGFGHAARMINTENINKLKKMRNGFEDKLKKAGLGIKIIAENSKRLPNTFMMYVPKIKAAELLMALDIEGFDVSTGSACSSGQAEPSSVLLHMGYSNIVASSVIRISLGEYNRNCEADKLIDSLKKIIKRFNRI